MTKRTIEQFAKAKVEKDKAIRPTKFVGCTCSNLACKTTWIVCELPQTMKRLATITGWHRQCPCCGTPEPKMATTAELRTLLTPEIEGA